METQTPAPKPALDFVFDSFEDVDSANVTIKDPVNGGPLLNPTTNQPVVFTLAGPEHPLRRKFMFDRQRKHRTSIMRTGKIQLDDPEQEEQDETEYLVDCVLGWSGTGVEFSKDAARRVLEDPKRQWLRAQVRVALDERERFIRRSVAS